MVTRFRTTAAAMMLASLSVPPLRAEPAAARPPNDRVCWLGDSRTANGLSGQVWKSRGTMTWARFLGRGRFVTDPADVFATFGYTTEQIVAEHLPHELADDCGTVVYLGGINDRTKGVPLDTTIANDAEVVRRNRAAGKIVILIAETPRGNLEKGGTFYSGQTLADHLQERQWLLRQAGPGVYVVDAWPALADPDSARGGNIPRFFGPDDVHPNQLGAYHGFAIPLAPLIAWLFPSPAKPVAATPLPLDSVSDNGVTYKGPPLALHKGDSFACSADVRVAAGNKGLATLSLDVIDTAGTLLAGDMESTDPADTYPASEVVGTLATSPTAVRADGNVTPRVSVRFTPAGTRRASIFMDNLGCRRTG